MSGENKPLNYTLRATEMHIGPLKGKVVYMASPTRRETVTYRRFCERVARGTSFTAQEVMATLNLAAEVARSIVANGDSVQFGDLGSLSPSFKSRVALSEDEFSVATHITKPVVKLSPSRKYFTLSDVRYQRVSDSAKPVPVPDTSQPVEDPETPGGGGSDPEEGGGGL